MNTKTYFSFLSISLLLCGCVANKANVKTYVNPSLNSSKINSVAIFPLRNAFVQRDAELSTGEMMDINRMFQMEFLNINPNTKLVDAISSTELLNKNSLVNAYDTLLRVYENTGIPNTQILNKIGTSLNIDAIFQGFVKEVTQRDGRYGGNRGETKVVIKYVMFSNTTGDVLWESIYDGYKGTGSTLEKAPPISDVIEIIKKKLPSSLPALSTL
jgi:hypothetical protein